jgi:hypothetical protein
MKRTIIITAALIGILFLQAFSTVQAQVYDDLYYTPGQNTGSAATEKYYDEDGDSYVVNNYFYDDNQWDDVSYVNSINRFYTPYYGFGFYSPCYNPWMWNGGWGWNVGWNSWGGWNIWGYPGYAWGNPWGWNVGWNIWGYPWGWNNWGNPYWNGYANGYWNGYANGYWNGYANGFYDGYYGGGVGNGYYYGPRFATASNTSGGRDYTPGEYGYDKQNDRSTNPTRYTPATKDAGQNGNVQQPSRNNQTYQWNDRSVKEQPAQQSRPTYTQPNNQSSRDGYNRSQPQQRSKRRIGNPE